MPFLKGPGSTADSHDTNKCSKCAFWNPEAQVFQSLCSQQEDPFPNEHTVPRTDFSNTVCIYIVDQAIVVLCYIAIVPECSCCLCHFQLLPDLSVNPSNFTAGRYAGSQVQVREGGPTNHSKASQGHSFALRDWLS